MLDCCLLRVVLFEALASIRCNKCLLAANLRTRHLISMQHATYASAICSVFSTNVFKFEEDFGVLGSRAGVADSLIQLCCHVIPADTQTQFHAGTSTQNIMHRLGCIHVCTIHDNMQCNTMFWLCCTQIFLRKSYPCLSLQRWSCAIC